MKNVTFMRYLAFSVAMVVITSTAKSQQGDPKETEVWEPVPEVITPGTGTLPPSDAIVLFNGTDMDEWVIPEGTTWTVHDGIVEIKPTQRYQDSPTAIESKRVFGDMQLHVEWRSPAEIRGGGQRRGNSGIIIQGRYEIQVLDNYTNRTYANGQAASVYKQTIPLVNACKKPGEWQTYDIIFTAPRFDDSGELESPAFVTVIHNGVLVQNHTEILGSIKFIGPPAYEPHPLKLPLKLQDHGDAVSYRNIWVREL